MALDLKLSSGRSDHEHGTMRIRSPLENSLSRSQISVQTRRPETHGMVVSSPGGKILQNGGTTWSKPRRSHSSLSKSSTSVQTRRPRTHALTITHAGLLQHGGLPTWSKPGTWHLVNLKTMKPVKSYEQLSRIMQNLGWSFYVTPQRDLWCTWRACHEADVQHACLPYPDIGAATRIELKRFVRRLEYSGLVGVFDVKAGELPAASRLGEEIKAGNVQVSLLVKGTNRRIESFKVLAEALVGRGWRRVSDNHFYRFESSPVTPICHAISVIHLPLLRSFRQVCLEDLESIVRLTGSLFYLRFNNNALTMDPALSLQIHKKQVEGQEDPCLDDSGEKALTTDDLRLWSRITRMVKKYSNTITSNNSPSNLCILLAHKHKSAGEEAMKLKAQRNSNGEEATVRHAGEGEETSADDSGIIIKKEAPTTAATPMNVWLSSRITRMVRKKKYGRMTTDPSSFCVTKHHKNGVEQEEED